MKVSALDNNGDWQFGRGKALYLTNQLAIQQCVLTRLKSFTNDWFLDKTAGIDWFGLLSNKNNLKTIENEIARVMSNTYGVLSIKQLTLDVNYKARYLKIIATVVTVYSSEFNIPLEVNL